MALTPEQNEFYDQLSLLFVHPGWKTFVETFQGFKDALKDQAYTHKTMEAYHFARGRMDGFDQVLGFQAFMEGLKEQLDSESEDDTEDHK